ncbi:MAG: hypothetical protein GC185_06195 [Alphaproteobacteria bacterium]|nr:hypothetical protein [Alphaproteobacteria bacterium]
MKKNLSFMARLGIVLLAGLAFFAYQKLTPDKNMELVQAEAGKIQAASDCAMMTALVLQSVTQGRAAEKTAPQEKIENLRKYADLFKNELGRLSDEYPKALVRITKQYAADHAVTYKEADEAVSSEAAWQKQRVHKALEQSNYEPAACMAYLPELKP